MITKLLVASCLLFAASLSPSFASARAGSGSVVGNGAGIVENGFQYAYTILGNIFSNCVENGNCDLDSDQLALVRAMSRIQAANVGNVDRLIFLSEKQSRGFFTTGNAEFHRIAKTGLVPDVPIYVNVDMLYEKDGAAAVDFPTTVSILVHELGHQTGECSHALLDILASKIKRNVSQNLSQHTLQFNEPIQSVEVLILNTEFPIRTSEVIFSWEEFGSANITSALVGSVKCSDPASVMTGFEIGNGRYFLSPENTEAKPRIGFGVWMDLICFSEIRHSTEIEKSDIQFEIGTDLKVGAIKTIRLNKIPERL